MNLWLRFLWLLLTAPFRPKIDIPRQTSILTCRVLPNDLDISMHMNNGRYLAVMDLGRLDLLIRSGLASAVWRYGWTPVANAALIRFRRELRAFDRYHLETRVVAWQEQMVLLEQTFVFAGGERDGQVAARALFKGALYDRKARCYVPLTDIMSEIGTSAPSPAIPSKMEAFLAADRTLRDAGHPTDREF